MAGGEAEPDCLIHQDVTHCAASKLPVCRSAGFALSTGTGPLACKVPDATPPAGTVCAARRDPALPTLWSVDRGSRSPERPPWPEWEVPRPGLGALLPPTPFIQGHVAVLAPGYRPDISVLGLAAPGDVSQAFRQIQDARLDGQRRRFPELLAVSPQPAREFGVLIATPGWSFSGTPILLDCRAFSGMISAAIAEAGCSREDLLRLAGAGGGAALQVQIADDEDPLAYGQVPVLVPGALVRISPFRLGRFVGSSFEEMLRSADHWDLGAPLPLVRPSAMTCLTGT